MPAVWLLRALAASAYVLAAGASHAAEGGFVATPIGGTDFRQALLPPPGSYAFLTGIGSWANDVRQQDGSASRLLRPEGHAYGGALGIGHVFDGTVLGGRVAVSAAGVAGRVCLEYRGTGVSQCQTGIGDAYTEVAWSRPIGDFGARSPAADDTRRLAIPYGLTVGVALGGIVPVGRYRRTDVAPVGLNTWVAMPSAAATYVSPPLLFDGTEVSARLFYNIHARNPATGYRTGDILVLDWGISERIGRVQLGPTGSWAHQLRADRLAGGRRGPHTEVTSLGAAVAVDVPERRMFLQAKFLTDLAAQYRLTIHRFFLRVAFAL